VDLTEDNEEVLLIDSVSNVVSTTHESVGQSGLLVQAPMLLEAKDQADLQLLQYVADAAKRRFSPLLELQSKPFIKQLDSK